MMRLSLESDKRSPFLLLVESLCEPTNENMKSDLEREQHDKALDDDYAGLPTQLLELVGRHGIDISLGVNHELSL